MRQPCNTAPRLIELLDSQFCGLCVGKFSHFLPQVHEEDMAIKLIGSSELPQVKVSVTGWPQTAGIHSGDGSLIWIVAFRSDGLQIQPGDWNILGLYVCRRTCYLRRSLRRSRVEGRGKQAAIREANKRQSATRQGHGGESDLYAWTTGALVEIQIIIPPISTREEPIPIGRPPPSNASYSCLHAFVTIPIGAAQEEMKSGSGSLEPCSVNPAFTASGASEEE